MPSDRLDFSRRAQLSEWMDEPCGYEEFRDCLRDLEKVNRMLGAYRPTLQWLDQFANTAERELHIVDVGCGGGDMLRRVGTWLRRRGLPARLTGIDLNPHAVRAAREFSGSSSSIEWIAGDAYFYQPSAHVSLVISSLFTHHLSDTEIVRFILWMESIAQCGWFINDLHRKLLPYYEFKALASFMRWHRFVRHDGPISIRRSFRRADWEGYCSAAGLRREEVQIREFLPGRLCVAREKR